MLLTNHTLTGLALSRSVKNPWLLAPTALASHLIIDRLPHFGRRGVWNLKRPPLVYIAIVDNLVALGIALYAFIVQPELRVQTVVGIFFATLPDLLFLADIFFDRPIKNAFTRFHSRIQWSETPQGAIVELAWAAVMVFALTRLVQ